MPDRRRGSDMQLEDLEQVPRDVIETADFRTDATVTFVLNLPCALI